MKKSSPRQVRIRLVGKQTNEDTRKIRTSRLQQAQKNKKPRLKKKTISKKKLVAPKKAVAKKKTPPEKKIVPKRKPGRLRDIAKAAGKRPLVKEAKIPGPKERLVKERVRETSDAVREINQVDEVTPWVAYEEPEKIAAGDKGKKKRRLWLGVIPLLLILSLTAGLGVFIYSAYLKSQKLNKEINSVDIVIGQTRYLLKIRSSAQEAIRENRKTAGTESGIEKSVSRPESPGNEFDFKSAAVYNLRIGDVNIMLDLQKLFRRPVKPAITLAPITGKAKPETRPVPIIRIKADPRSVPEGGITKLSALVSEENQARIASIIWGGGKGQIIQQDGLKVVWKAPDKRGLYRVKIVILAQDGSRSTKYLKINISQNIYIADVQNHCIQKFNTRGEFLFKFGGEGKAIGRFDSPNSVAIDNQRNIWVADTGNHRIQKFTRKGKFVLGFGGYGTAEGQFDEPYVIAVDSYDNIYVAEYGNRIQKFDSQGKFILQFGGEGDGDGEFDRPSGIYIDRHTRRLYVSDMGNHRVQKFDLNGKFLMKFGTEGSGQGEFKNPVGIAINSKSDIYVVDQVNHRIQKFDKNGKYKLWFGGEGGEDGRLYYPMGIVINRADEIFVTDQCNHRVSVYDTQGNYFTSFGQRGSENGQLRFPIGISLDY